VNQNILDMNRYLAEAEDMITTLDQRTTTMQNDVVKNLVDSLRDHKAKLHADLQERMARLDADLRSLISEQSRTLNIKHDELHDRHVAMENRVEVVQSSYASLEDRYENISTDALHQHMVRWFVENYPSANIITQIQGIQQQLLSYRSLADRMQWVEENGDTLLQLANVGPGLTGMVCQLSSGISGQGLY
jgi:chromosome segregation ATPase